MTIPSRPRSLLEQGPATSCIIDGRALGWLNCLAEVFAMGIDRSSLGAKRPDGCDVRRHTGDTSGGLNLRQCATVAGEQYGVLVEVRDPRSSLLPPELGAAALRNGRAIALQGNASALLDDPRRSTAGPVNHGVLVTDGIDWSHDPRSGAWTPRLALVYDPSADGRSAWWGRAAQGPDWWPWSTVLAFGAALRPWGDTDPRVLGPGRWYAGLFPDTEPHAHLRYAGSRRTAPFPSKLIVRPPVAGKRQVVRSGPSTAYPRVATMALGEMFTAYQQNPAGQLLAGSRLWWGDHDGRRWIHSSGLR